MAISLTGNVTDITGKPVSELTSATIKTPTYSLPSLARIVTSSPRDIAIGPAGDFSVTVEEGKAYLYLTGPGWTETIPLWVLPGMVKIGEAIIEALHVDPVLKSLFRMLAQLGNESIADLTAKLAEINARIAAGEKSLADYISRADAIIKNALSASTASKGQVLAWDGTRTYWSWAGRFPATYSNTY